MDNLYPIYNKSMRNLRLSVVALFAVFSIIDMALLLILSPFLREPDQWIYLQISLGIGVFWFWKIWKNLGYNCSPGDDAFLPYLGLPNSLTIVRGYLIALTAGLALIPSRPVVWLPAILYLAAVSLDGVDGIVARLRGKVTALGGILDMEIDGITVLVGALAVLLAGTGSLLILLVGAARYIFIGAQFVFSSSGRVIQPLPDKPSRRAMAGLMMGFLAAAQFPVFYPPALRFISNFIAIPFLIGFLDDWFLVSGQGLAYRQKWVAAMKNAWVVANRWLLPGSRIGTIILLGITVTRIQVAPGWAYLFIGFMAFFIAGIITGTAGRLCALIIAGMVSLNSTGFDLSTPILLILSSSCMIFLMGTGRFSFWKPEDALIFHRIGDYEKP